MSPAESPSKKLAGARTPNDTLFRGKLRLAQLPKDAYRANVDALLLAAFAADGKRCRRAWDLGAGVGTVGLSLLLFDKAAHVTFVDDDPKAVACVGKNLDCNGWGDRGEALLGDVLELSRHHVGEADLVVANPPYFAPHASRSSPFSGRARGRTGPLAPFVQAARQLAGKKARVFFVYPASDFVTLASTLRATGLEPKRVRLVHPRIEDPARIALVESVAARPGGLCYAPPLVERAGPSYTEEMTRLLEGTLFE
jgi:tRNA1Val (adenine37-N6)-methyltransferase